MARGYDIKDAKLFSSLEVQKLKMCVEDTVHLLNRGYPFSSSLQFTANHYRCPSRQILMLSRAICSDNSLRVKREKEQTASALEGATLYIDGFNLIITLEILFSGGTLFIARDGCVRDIAGMRGSYHLIDETDKAIGLLAKAVNELKVANVVFYLDSPISNSGNLKSRLFHFIDYFNCPIEVDLVFNPDVQMYGKSIVATADGIILENCQSWFNLAQYCIEMEKEKIAIDFSQF